MRAIRHLPTDARMGEFNGWRNVNVHLDWQGHPFPSDRQMEETCASLKSFPPNRIFCSPLLRAQKTAEIILSLTRLSIPIITVENLKELHFGKWEGLTWSEIEGQFPLEAQHWINDWIVHHPPMGESLLDLEKRIQGFFFDHSPTENDVIVCHAGVIKLLMALETGNREALQNQVPYHSIHDFNISKILSHKL